MCYNASMYELKRHAYLLGVNEILQQLRVRRDTGLTQQEVSKRRHIFGLNFIPRHKPRSPFLIFLDRFKDPLVILLVLAAIASPFIGHSTDSIVIIVAIFLDVTLSFAQVWRTQRTLDHLRENMEQRAVAVRDSRLANLPARELVPGDIIELRGGQKIPADCRIIEASGLKVNEAPLTGEAEDIPKSPASLTSRTPMGNRKNMLFLGTTIMSGTCRAVVIATGTQTEIGKIAQVLKDEKSPITPLRRKLNRSVIWIAVIILILITLISVLNIVSGRTLLDSVHTAITLIVSAIPEDLTIILTVALTVGVARILRHKGVVRELSSGETLGAATVICTDKTGTLTQGAMKAESFSTLAGAELVYGTKPSGHMLNLAYTGFALATDAHRVSSDVAEYIGSATERTALAFVEKVGFQKSKLTKKWRPRSGIQFDARWKYRATLHDHPTNSSQIIFVSGAPEVLLEQSSHALNQQSEVVPLTSQQRANIQRKFISRATNARRLIAVAVKTNLSQSDISHDDIHQLTFLGILSISDPLRPDVREAIHQTQEAGVAIKLVTGDHQVTACAVARGVGLTVTDDNVLDGALLQDLSDKELRRVVNHITVFSRVEPLDKQRIVKALQSQGHVVAMTGDGANDAVALSVADIGVAMGSGKDIAKDAAKLILLDDNFATIVAAIREGRVIRDNVRKVIGFLLATNAAEVLIFLVSLLLGLPLPLLPAQILWINIVTDGSSDLALSLEPEERNVMHRPPEDPAGSLITKPLVLQILIAGLIMTAFSTLLYWFTYQVIGFDLAYVRTLIFSLLAVTALLSTWSYRSLWEPIWRRGITQNPWLFASAGFSFLLQLAAIYLPGAHSFFGTVPLALTDWGIVILLAILAVIAIDIRKYIAPLPNGHDSKKEKTNSHHSPVQNMI